MRCRPSHALWSAAQRQPPHRNLALAQIRQLTSGLARLSAALGLILARSACHSLTTCRQGETEGSSLRGQPLRRPAPASPTLANHQHNSPTHVGHAGVLRCVRRTLTLAGAVPTPLPDPLHATNNPIQPKPPTSFMQKGA